MLAPHLGYVTRQNYRTYFTQALEGVEGFFSGAPVRVVEDDESAVTRRVLWRPAYFPGSGPAWGQGRVGPVGKAPRKVRR